MIYEFKSRATGSVVMTRDVAEMILRVIGKSPASQGIITVDAMPAAIAALQAAAAHDNQQTEDKDGRPVISLGQRANPFIDMLKATHAAGKDITWGL